MLNNVVFDRSILKVLQIIETLYDIDSFPLYKKLSIMSIVYGGRR